MIAPPSKEHFPVENDETGRQSGQESLSQCRDIEGRADDIVIPPRDCLTNGELASVQEESSSNLTVASSLLVEVKLSLSLNLASGRPDF